MRLSPHLLRRFGITGPRVDRGLQLLTTSANHGRLWIAAAAVGAVAGKRQRRAAIRAMTSLGGASLLVNSVIKPLIGRRRPDPASISPLRRLSKAPWTSSFPSGHAASAAAFATGAALELPAAAPLLAPLAAAVGYSRVHVGVHYPSDVVVGAGIGAGLALLGHRIWPVRPAAPARTAPGDAPALPAGRGLTVVLNSASGSAEDAEPAIREALPSARIVRWDPDDDLDATVGGPQAALGVAGGDGTVATVAALAVQRGLPLAVFPGGTLNHFAGALALETAQDTADAVAAGTAGQVSVATLNGRTFLNTAGIGSYPEMVERRDRLSHRIGKWPAAAVALLHVMRHGEPLELSFDGRRERVWAVFVGNGPYTPRGFAPSWREELASGVLDVQYVRADGVGSRTIAVLASLVGVVERTGVYGTVQATKLVIGIESGPVPVAHDGEVTDPVDRVELAVESDLLTVYRP